ncbi:melanin-concentrating hormone receptor 1 [Hippoglossus hippoglossus]|uniref:melanin-concentrating hormone receptor 1 n=1 Tax=Hippoglossus hippoglossus TaxID=8267 RepID=UPI00148DE21A|nr:melanin-concentrating hormone receptor 1 [Hippoglossus hippoglossus]XP_035040063.1 melanin-concentrating hormone receptor 1 [Hippoglossus stenolepis]
MDFHNDSNFSVPHTNSTTPAEDGALHCSAILPVIFGIICFLGIFGNCIVMYTIIKKTKCRAKQTVPDIFILNVSIVDLLFLLGMPFLIHQLLGNGSWHFGATMCTVITALDSNSQIVSTYILTAMTLDRYLATVHPIRFNYVRTPCVAALVIVIVWGLSFLTIIPVWMYAGLMHLPDGLVACALLLPNPITDTYWFTLYQFFLAFAMPLFIICLVFFKMLQHMSSSVAPLPPRSLRVRTRKVTRMAVAICLAFFICWAPYYILQLVHLGVQKPTLAFSYAYNIAISMGYANSCINPFLYIILSETFKRQFLRAVRPVNRKFRVNPSTTDGGSVSMRLVPEGGQQKPAPQEMMPSNVAPQ